MDSLTLLALVLFVASIIGTVIANVVLNLAASELYDWAPRIAEWFVERAVVRLQPEHRARYGEQFRADLAEIPGHLGQVWYAFRIYLGRNKLAREAEESVEQEVDDAILRNAGIWALTGWGLWAVGNWVAAFAPGNRTVDLIASFILYNGVLSLVYVLYLRTKLYKRPKGK